MVEDISNITELDKLKLIPKSETNRIDKYLNEDNEIVTVIQLLDSENIYEDWMTKPHKIVIDAEGATTFSESGAILSASPHSEDYPTTQYAVEKSLFVTLPTAISEEQKSNIENQGFIVYTNVNGTTSITKDGIEIHYNPNAKSMEKIISIDGALVYSEKRTYKTLTSGEQVLERVTSKDYVTFNNGACAEKVTVKINTEHEVAIKAEQKSSADFVAQNNQYKPLSFQVFPVPVGDLLTISAKSEVAARSWFSIAIFDTNGRKVFMEHEQNPFPYNISTGQLPKGTYIIKIKGKKTSWTERFIKL